MTDTKAQTPAAAEQTDAAGTNWHAWVMSIAAGACAVMAAYRGFGEPAAWSVAAAWFAAGSGVHGLPLDMLASLVARK